MSRILLKWAGIVLLTWYSLPALALPTSFVQEGLVYTDNQPLNGAYRVEVALYNDDRAGRQLFSEVHPDVTFINGYYAIAVGSEKSDRTRLVHRQ